MRLRTLLALATLLLLVAAPAAAAKTHEAKDKDAKHADPAPGHGRGQAPPPSAPEASPAPTPKPGKADAAPPAAREASPAAQPSFAPALPAAAHAEASVVAPVSPTRGPPEKDPVAPWLAPGDVTLESVALPMPTGAPAWALPLLGFLALGAVFVVGAKPHRFPLAQSEPGVEVSLGDARSLLRLAQAEVARGRFDAALARFDQAIAQDGRIAVAHFCRALCLAQLARHDEALHAMREARRLDPNEGAFILEHARCAARAGESGEAMDALAPLLAAMPELGEEIGQDAAFAGLFDHPRFLILVGRL